MKNKKAFTLVEVLISLFISSFIMFGMMQLYRNLQNFIEKTSITMKFNREVYLLFSQMEKDFSTSIIPVLPKEEKDSSKKDLSEKEKKPNYFISEIFDGEYKRVEGKRLHLFKSVNFINTNPLFVHNEKIVRLVRVSYSLQKNKKLSNSDRSVYDLYRKETEDLSNDKFKKTETVYKKDKEKPVKIYLIAKNVKHFSVEYKGFKKEEDDKTKSDKKQKKKMISSFTWGKDKGTQNILPKKILINISLWDSKLVSEDSFNCVIQTFVVELKDKNKSTQDTNKPVDSKTTGKSAPGKHAPGKHVPGRPVPGRPVPGRPVPGKSPVVNR